ncbi:MAG TPA: efflux RND transporter periplasmic adaptor subunit [Longimicrobiaceae bacterium]
MNKRGKMIGATIAALAIVGLAGVGIASQRESAIEVRTETVQRRDLVSVVTASGVIQPKRKVDISADVSGRVVELAVVEGQVVERGDLLLRIDPTTFEAAVRRAEAMVAQARAQEAQARANLLQATSAAERAERLASGDRLISEQELEQARTQQRVAEAQYEAARYGVLQATASLNEAQEALRKTTIVSPMTGRVTRLNIEEGETAIVGTMNNPGSLLLTVADLGEMEASVKVDETDVPHISIGDSAVVRIDAFPNKTFSGKVTQIANSAIQGQGAMSGAATTQQNQSVDFEVVITLDNPPESLRPDLSATAEIITETRQMALSVPIISVTVRDPDGKKFNVAEDAAAAPSGAAAGPAQREREVEGVFVLDGGTAKWVPIEIGIAGNQYFEVLDGLTGGEVVIAGPYAAVRDLEAGAAVRTTTPPPPAKTTQEET